MPVIDAASAAMVARLAVGIHNTSTVQYAIGVYYATDAGTTRVDRTGVGAWAVGVPVNPAWVPPPGSDGSIAVVDQEQDRQWCLWQYNPATLSFAGGGWADPSSDVVTTVAGTATGANFAFGAGLIRCAELEAGRINHALVFATDVADNGLATPGYGSPSLYRFPATRTDAQNLRGVSSGRVPEGARVQLDPAVDLSTVPAGYQRTIAAALQEYGAFCVDNGGISLNVYTELHPWIRRSPTAEYEPVAERARLQGVVTDYADLSGIPWDRLRVLASWNGL